MMVILIIIAIAALTCWPAMAWHGYGGPSGTDWRWDIHSTVACLVYWGILLVIAVVIVAHRGISPETRRRAASAFLLRGGEDEQN